MHPLIHAHHKACAEYAVLATKKDAQIPDFTKARTAVDEAEAAIQRALDGEPQGPVYGQPCDPNKAPSAKLARGLLLRLETLLAPGKGANGRLEKARELLRAHNDYEVWTQNMLNRDAGLFPIHARSKDSCCDPATERYHCM